MFNKMKCWQGSLGISEYRGIVSPAYIVCKPKKLFHGKYFHHLLRSYSYIQEFNRLSYGVTIVWTVFVFFMDIKQESGYPFRKHKFERIFQMTPLSYLDNMLSDF